MKTNKLPYVIAAFLVLSLTIVACSKTDEKTNEGCGDETVAGLTVDSWDTFKIYDSVDGVSAGNALYNTYYHTTNGRSYFGMRVKLDHVCREDLPFISAELRLKTPKSDITDSIVINYTGTPKILSFSVPEVSTGFYQFGEPITLGGTSNDIELSITSAACFPTKGSIEADSAYFFENFTKLSVAITAKKSK